MLNLFTKHSVGIDISDRTIEVVELVNDRNGIRVWSKNRMKLEPGLVERGVIKDRVKLSAVVRKALRDARPRSIVSRDISFGLPECQVYIHNFVLGAHKKEDRNTIVLEEAQKNIPLESEDLLYSYKVFHEEAGNTEIILVATSRKFVSDWKDFFQFMDLRVEAFDIESLASFRGLFLERPKAPICVVDIGAVTTHIAIFNKWGLWYSYALDIAGKALTEEITTVMGKNTEDAEKLKKEFGLSQPDEQISFVLTKILHPVVADIKATIDYFQENTRQKVKEIIFIGGTAKLKGLAGYASANIGIPVKIGRPALLSVQGGKPSLPLEYLGAVGLALRHLDKKWEKSDPEIILDTESKSYTGAPAVPASNFFDKFKKSSEQKKELKTGSESVSQNDQKTVLSNSTTDTKGRLPKTKLNTKNKKMSKQITLLIIVLALGATAIWAAYWYKGDKEAKQQQEVESRLEALNLLEKINSEKNTTTTPVVSEPKIEEEPTVIIIATPTGWLNVRKGPGTSYAKSAKVYPDEGYTLLDEDGGWYKIQIDDETEGWITADYAEKQ